MSSMAVWTGGELPELPAGSESSPHEVNRPGSFALLRAAYAGLSPGFVSNDCGGSGSPFLDGTTRFSGRTLEVSPR